MHPAKNMLLVGVLTVVCSLMWFEPTASCATSDSEALDYDSEVDPMDGDHFEGDLAISKELIDTYYGDTASVCSLNHLQ